MIVQFDVNKNMLVEEMGLPRPGSFFDNHKGKIGAGVIGAGAALGATELAKAHPEKTKEITGAISGSFDKAKEATQNVAQKHLGIGSGAQTNLQGGTSGSQDYVAGLGLKDQAGIDDAIASNKISADNADVQALSRSFKAPEADITPVSPVVDQQSIIGNLNRLSQPTPTPTAADVAALQSAEGTFEPGSVGALLHQAGESIN